MNLKVSPLCFLLAGYFEGFFFFFFPFAMCLVQALKIGFLNNRGNAFALASRLFISVSLIGTSSNYFMMTGNPLR